MFALIVFAPQVAQAEAIPNLNSTALAECPDCGTSQGGAEAINLMERMGGLEGRTVDYAPADSGSWSQVTGNTYTGSGSGVCVGGATSCTVDFSAEATAIETAEESLATATNASTAADVASLIDAAGVAGGIIPEAGMSGVGTLLWPPALGVLATVAIGTGTTYLIMKILGGGPTGPGSSPITNMSIQWSDCPYTPPPSSGYAWTTIPCVYGSPGVFIFTYAQNSQYWRIAHNASATWNYTYGPTTAPPGLATLTGDSGYGWPADPGHFKVYWAYPSSLVRAPLVASSSPTGAKIQVHPGTTMPSRATLAAGLAAVLNQPPIPGHNVGAWLESHISHTPDADPTRATANATLSSCATDFASCKSALQSAGFTGTITDTTLDFDHAELDHAASAPTYLTIGSSTVALPSSDTLTKPADDTITIETNPDAASMPVAVPQPQPDETVDDYTARAQAVGLIVNPQAEADADEDLLPDAVTRVSPDDRALPDATLDVFFNPETPATADNDEPDCRLSDPSGMDPLPSAIDYFDIYQGTTFTRTLGDRELGFPGTAQTALLVGDVKVVDFAQGFKGFGYRKIKAKHGWGVVDAEATADALRNEPIISNWDGQPGTATYTGFQYTGQNGTTCERVVVVTFVPRLDEPAPRELITSFGKKVTLP